MKLLPVFLVVFFGFSSAALSEDVRTIEVTGTATSKGDVDKVTWRISIRGEGELLKGAAGKLKEATSALSQRIDELEIGENAFRLSRVRSGRTYEQTRDGKRTLTGYFAERGGFIQTDKLDLAEKIEEALLEDDGIEIEKLELESTLFEQLKKQAGIDAVEAAREKAKTMAGVLGVEVGEVLSIREGSSGNYPVVLTENRIEMPVFGQTGGRAVFEQVEQTATVTLRFALK